MPEKKDWNMVTTKLPEDVHASLLIIKEQYGENMGDALREYIRAHTPDVLAQAVEVATAKHEVKRVLKGKRKRRDSAK